MRLAAVLLLCLAGAAGAQSIPYERYELDNGLVVILHEDHSLPRVAVNLWYRVGSKDEEPGRSGFAHLFEHLMFMGTRRVPGTRFDHLMEAGGGSNNASTGEDRTNYWSYGPSGLLETLLWLEADRMEDLGAEMTREKLDLQREVVRNERRQNYEIEPYGMLWIRLPELVFPDGHPYHHSVMGSHEDLQAATVDDVKSFFARFYVPNNASLVVAGDFEPAAARTMIAKYFGDLPARPIGVRPRPAPVRIDHGLVARYEEDVPYARTDLVWHSPARYEPGDAEMDLVARILTSGKSSRLYKRLVYEEELASEVHAWQESLALGGMFCIDSLASEGVSLEDVEAAIDEEILLLAQLGPTAEELARAVNAVETETLSNLQSIDEKADQLNAYEFYRGEPDSFAWDLDRYRRATASSVAARAAELLRPEARVAIRTYPAPERPETSARDERPAIGSPRRFDPPPPVEFELSNGIPVRLWQRTGLPLVAIRTVFPAGAASDPPGREGLARLTGEMLDEGAGGCSALEFSDALEVLGASFDVAVGRRSTDVDLSVLVRNLEPAARLYADAIRRPAFDAEEFERVRDLEVVEIEQSLEDPGAIASAVLARRWYGDGHPYAHPASGTIESVGRVETADVSAFHRSAFRPERAMVLVAGDLDAVRAKALLESLFGDWRAGEDALPLEAPEIREPERGPLAVYLVDQPGSVQTVILWSVPAPPRGTPDRLAIELLGTVFGGTFTSRLNANLREDKGYTYGAYAGFDQDPYLGSLDVSTTVEAGVTGDSLAEIAREFAAMREGGVTDEEVEKARRTVWTSRVERYSSLDTVLSTASSLLEDGADLGETALDLAALESIGRARLDELAEERFRTDRGVVVLVGDRETILEQLDGLGLPKPIDCDVHGVVRE